MTPPRRTVVDLPTNVIRTPASLMFASADNDGSSTILPDFVQRGSCTIAGVAVTASRGLSDTPSTTGQNPLIRGRSSLRRGRLRCQSKPGLFNEGTFCEGPSATQSQTSVKRVTPGEGNIHSLMIHQSTAVLHYLRGTEIAEFRFSKFDTQKIIRQRQGPFRATQPVRRCLRDIHQTYSEDHAAQPPAWTDLLSNFIDDKTPSQAND